MLSEVDGSKHNLFVFKPSLEPSTRSILELLIHLRYNCAVRGGITMISSGTVDVRAFAQVTRIRIKRHFFARELCIPTQVESCAIAFETIAR